jgi:hypothetical protein
LVAGGAFVDSRTVHPIKAEVRSNSTVYLRFAGRFLPIMWRRRGFTSSSTERA